MLQLNLLRLKQLGNRHIMVSLAFLAHYRSSPNRPTRFHFWFLLVTPFPNHFVDEPNNRELFTSLPLFNLQRVPIYWSHMKLQIWKLYTYKTRSHNVASHNHPALKSLARGVADSRGPARNCHLPYWAKWNLSQQNRESVFTC